MAGKELRVIVLWAFALCVLAVTLVVVLLPPGLSWATVLQWLTTQPTSPCACQFSSG